MTTHLHKCAVWDTTLVLDTYKLGPLDEVGPPPIQFTELVGEGGTSGAVGHSHQVIAYLIQLGLLRTPLRQVTGRLRYDASMTKALLSSKW